MNSKLKITRIFVTMMERIWQWNLMNLEFEILGVEILFNSNIHIIIQI